MKSKISSRTNLPMKPKQSGRGTSRILTALLPLIGIFNPLHAFSDQYCRLVTKHLDSWQAEDWVFFEDRSIRSVIDNIHVSFAFFGQKPTEYATRKRALNLLLSDTTLSADTIQSAHHELTGKKSALRFRDDGDAKELGFMSFKSYHLLNDSDLAQVEANPFLTFVSQIKRADVSGIRDRWNIGDIEFPNTKNASKFKTFLSAKAQRLLSANKLSNTKLLEDLVSQSIEEANINILAGKPSHEVLGVLEWRIKSLGLYYEQTYKQHKTYIESNFSQIDLNKSSEIAELIVDAFAIQYRILDPKKAHLQRIYRPKLTDGVEQWIEYMRTALDGSAAKRTKTLLRDLIKAEKKLPLQDQELFETYYLTRVISGVDMLRADSESILSDFKTYKSRFHSSRVPEKDRTTLIPLSYIRSFGSTEVNYAEYLSKYFLADKTLFRGVSNPRGMSETEFLEYFYSFKGRYASELARSSFDDRIALAQLSMIRYNADLIQGKLVDEALQHSAKHAGFEDPNSAKTYLTSMTEHDTIAFRFAADKGYIDESSAAIDGRSHFVIETFWPKQGAVNFSSFRQFDDNWRNFYPRQKETAIAGGVDPLSVKRIYVIEDYKPGDRIPSVGPEKHGRIIQIYERDLDNPKLIWKLKRNEKKEWVRDVSKKI